MFSPGNGMGCTLSSGACSALGLVVMSTRRVRPLSAAYSFVRACSKPISSSTASSISRNSMGTRHTSISEPVTIAAVSSDMASIGSSAGAYSTSTLMCERPCTVSVVDPTPSTRTPSCSR